jgi:hypothetical protein
MRLSYSFLFLLYIERYFYYFIFVTATVTCLPPCNFYRFIAFYFISRNFPFNFAKFYENRSRNLAEISWNKLKMLRNLYYGFGKVLRKYWFKKNFKKICCKIFLQISKLFAKTQIFRGKPKFCAKTTNFREKHSFMRKVFIVEARLHYYLKMLCENTRRYLFLKQK